MAHGIKRRHKSIEDEVRSRMCASHSPLFEWFPDDRIERGERQERCAACLHWLWPDERGPNFVSTGESDQGETE